MTAYVIGHLRPAAHHDDIVRYIELIQDTLDPFDGRFLVHGAEVEVIEGAWPGGVVIIGFPDLAAAHDWYDSPAYQEILPLRTDHIEGDVIFVEGVAPEYDAKRTAAHIKAQAQASA
ncbi:DUF1330 domain-containing protein [Streptomyces odontomachi]|uniref:DUF1330 domain-containing protein n=1 Tax=Streptomyces odontomachi TaxID=2944940 RepID=UPI00210C3668|nr:DUF1330 domain-containing protein [Streptomyces sp. ODS25]